MSRSFNVLCMDRRARYGDAFDNSQLNGRFAEAYDMGPESRTGIEFGNGKVGSGYLGVSDGPVPHFVINTTPTSGIGVVVDMNARPV